MTGKVLIIDDEEKLRSLLARLLKLEGYEITESANLKSAFKAISAEQPDVILCDVKLPDGNGIDFIIEVKQKYPLTEIILLTAYGNIPDAIQAMKNGAFDYITKADENNKIIPLLARAFEKIQLTKRVKQLEQKVEKKYAFENIAGKSTALQSAIDLAKKVAATDTTVLLTGETGTGKEVFAQSIHYGSRRNNKNFVAINCSAFSKELLESEMFGHVAGAFTGAAKDKKGLFEEADEGTIFLDEIGEMSVDLQAKLLRVLETGEFIKVGESKTTKVNVRIIAATNRNLQQEIKDARFRQDLYYRLSVFEITLPPLRERLQDIELLAKKFAQIFADKTNKKISSLSEDFLDALKLHDWPGNIRELKNVIERAVILSNTEILTTDSLPFNIAHSKPDGGKILSAFDLASAEKLHIQKVMNYTGGNKTEAARLLNIGLTTLYRKIEEYKIF